MRTCSTHVAPSLADDFCAHHRPKSPPVVSVGASYRTSCTLSRMTDRTAIVRLRKRGRELETASSAFQTALETANALKTRWASRRKGMAGDSEERSRVPHLSKAFEVSTSCDPKCAGPPRRKRNKSSLPRGWRISSGGRRPSRRPWREPPSPRGSGWRVYSPPAASEPRPEERRVAAAAEDARRFSPEPPVKT